MKILIVVSKYSNSWPFLQELRSNLQTLHCDVDILDTKSLYILKNNDNVVYGNKLLAKINKRRFVNKLSYPLSLKYFIKDAIGKYDCINIHNLEKEYLNIIPLFKKYSKQVSLTIWGSDFYRATEDYLQTCMPIFQELNFIVFNNPYTLLDFQKKFPQFKEKLVSTGFGIGLFDVIKNMMPALNETLLRQEFGLPPQKIIVTVGYNAREGQQHHILLQAIKHLSPEAKSKIAILVPLNYGSNPAYVQSVKASIAALNIPYAIIEDFQPKEFIAKLRIVSQIVINAQITDAFSGSLQEHVFSGNILLAGNWLPYKILADNNIKYWPIAKDAFAPELESAITNFENYKAQTINNATNIYNLSSWQSKISVWYNFFKLVNN